MNKHFCSAPWIGTTFETTESFKPCCYIDNSKLNIKASSFEEYYNSTGIKNLRKQFINGEKPDVCRRCWLSESNDESVVDSMRKRMNIQAKTDKLIDKIFELTNEDGEVSESIVSWADLQFSNKCNYSCIICSPYRSRSIEKKYLKEYRILSGDIKKIDLENDNESKILTWLETEGYKTIKLLVINGGEPFLQDGFYKMLDIFMKKGADKDCVLSLSTNGSISKSPEGKDVINDYLKKWNNTVKLQMSIDHHGKKGEFLRPGYSDEVWLSNYNKFSREKNISIRTSIALSLLNTPTIHQLFEMFSNKLLPETINYTHLVHSPESISFGQIQLEKNLLDTSIKSLDESIKIMQNFSPKNVGLIESAKDVLVKNFKGNKFYLPYFREGIRAIEVRKDLNFLDIFPEHKQFWELSLQSGAYPRPNLLN